MLESYYSINQAAGINIHLLADGISIDACHVTISNNRLNIEKKVTAINKIEDLAKHFHQKTFFALNLTGKGVLQKQVAKIEEVGQSNFGTILPNASIDDFYVQNFISGEFSFISVIRKTDADKWITHLTQSGFKPLILSLGPFPVQHILGQLNVYDSEVIFNHHVIRRNETGNWGGYEYQASALSPFKLKVESESLDERLLLPYAATFQLVMANKIEPVQAQVPALAQAYRNEVETKKFKTYGVVVLGVFFVLLLANFFLLSWLNSSNEQLTGQLTTFAQTTTDAQKISEQVQQKKSLVKALGWDGNINKSAMLDQVASLLPDEITWKEAAVDPVDISATRVQKSVAFFNNRIRIRGDAEKIVPVNEWIARIKTLQWVKNAQLDSYAVNTELNTGQFVILIDY